MTIEYPIFVPLDEEHIAAVITVPDAPARGLVLLLQGLGAPRHHRYSVWARMARELAAREIASARLDYPEVGDSTGSFPGGLNDPPRREAEAVADVAMQALSLSSFVAIGNCMGMRAALRLAAEERCAGVACIATPAKLLRQQRVSLTQRVERKLLNKGNGLRRVARTLVRGVSRSSGLAWVPEVRTAIESVPALFVFHGPEDAAGRFRGYLAALAASVHPPRETRIEFRSFVATRTREFQWPVAMQQELIETLVEWIDDVIPTDRAMETTGVTHADSHGG